MEDERNEHGGAVEADAEQGHEEDAGGVSAIFEDAQIHDGIFDVKLVDQKCDERNDGDDGNGGDPTGAEPIFFLALIEDDLQRGDSDGEQADAPVIDFLRSAADVRRDRR